ncbi:MAG: ABC transporter ATP-binding protein [Acidimicrobiales bacterium]
MKGAASLQEVWYWYPAWGDDPPAALAGVDVELFPGVTVVAGDSAAGKSTLLRVLNGLVPHFHGGRIAGRAETAGLDVLSTRTRVLARHVGFVFQEPEVGFVRGVVRREVAFTAENLGIAPGVIRHSVEEVLCQVGIGHLADRRLATLSGGERQRVALAAALVGAPQIVALDEPTSQLDDAGAGALVEALYDMAHRGHTVVVAEHRVDRFPDARVVGMERGALVGSPAPAASPALHASPVLAPTHLPDGSPAGAGSLRTQRCSPSAPVTWQLEQVTSGIAGRAVVVQVDLAGREGEVVVLTGPNGAGKTTILRTIAGLVPPLSGRVERRPGRIAYLPQDPGALLHRQSVLDEVRQTLRWSRSSEDPAELLDALGLGAVAGRDPRDLSGGQRQRAALAAVMAGAPKLVLLDEPTRGMDAASRSALAAMLDHLCAGGASVVMATHDAHLAGQLADQVVRVDSGSAVLQSPAVVAW